MSKLQKASPLVQANVKAKKEKAEIDWSAKAPWGSLGVDLPKNASLDQILKAAHLDWEVERTPLFHEEKKSFTGIEGFAGIRRTDTNAILDICGSQWKPVQNRDSFAFFKKFVEAGKAKLTAAGECSGGRLVWAMADLNNSFTIGKDDTIKCKLLLANPHEQGKSWKMSLLAERLVCSNGIIATVTQGAFKMSHRMVFDEAMMERAERVLGLANDNFDKMAATIQALAKKKLSTPRTLTYFANVFHPELKDAPPDRILEEGNKSLQLAVQSLEYSPGHNLPGTLGTAWGALNAVTYVTDHLLGRSEDTRLRRAWFGKNAALKQRALDLATHL